ncbi:unnamed protein product [Parnassius mnemosyne]|uniref:Uncharacterized protein n=1 Tax=Parnassius mnemosyne TaxID=213953 RepID=A0AAV1MD00_9NEOP
MLTETLPLNQRLRAMKNISGPQTSFLFDRIKEKFERATGKSVHKENVINELNVLPTFSWFSIATSGTRITTSTVAPQVTKATNGTEKIKPQCTDLAKCRVYLWEK